MNPWKRKLANLFRIISNSINGTQLTNEFLAEFNKRTNNRIQSSQVALNAIVGSGITVLPGSHIDKHSSIESYVYIGNNCFITKAHICRYTGIGNNISIGPGEHYTNRVSNNARFYKATYDELTQEPCKIGPDAWIGVDSIIKRGVEIGISSIVGANSFVNRNVPPFAIVAGSPARLIRYRLPTEQIKMIIDSKWWELEIEDARELICKLTKELSEL